MKSVLSRVFVFVSGIALLAGTARAETKVELSGVHLCCGACVAAVGKVLKAEGCQGTCDREGKTVTFTAADDKAAQKTLDALAKAGFHGETGSKTLAIKDDSGAPQGKVKSVTVSGIHNCCPACTRGIKATLKSVAGVKEDTAKSKVESFDVTGDFDAGELVKAFNAAGFHVKVEKK